MGNMFPLMDGKEHRLLKERMTEKKMEEKQELGIGSKAQESRSLCDGFICLEITTECFFLLFGTRRKENGNVW